MKKDHHFRGRQRQVAGACIIDMNQRHGIGDMSWGFLTTWSRLAV